MSLLLPGYQIDKAGGSSICTLANELFLWKLEIRARKVEGAAMFFIRIHLCRKYCSRDPRNSKIYLEHPRVLTPWFRIYALRTLTMPLLLTI
jgi:hypothetical protein